jgi:hypothetical protein
MMGRTSSSSWGIDTAAGSNGGHTVVHNRKMLPDFSIFLKMNAV